MKKTELMDMNLRGFPTDLVRRINKIVFDRQQLGKPAKQSSVAAELIEEGLKKIKK